MTQRDKLSIERLCCPLTQVENIHGWRSRVWNGRRRWKRDRKGSERSTKWIYIDGKEISRCFDHVYSVLLCPRGMQDSRSTFSFPLLPYFLLSLSLSPSTTSFIFPFDFFLFPLFQRQCNILTTHSTVRKWLLETVKDALIHGFSTWWSGGQGGSKWFWKGQVIVIYYFIIFFILYEDNITL